MSSPANDRESRLQSVLHAYLQARDRGKSPDRQALLDAHPDLRDELAEYFADASKLEQVARSMRTLSFGAGEPSGVSRRIDPGAHAPGLATVRYFGDYELLEEIARGGMGVVFKARQVSLNRLVALKMILKGELGLHALWASLVYQGAGHQEAANTWREKADAWRAKHGPDRRWEVRTEFDLVRQELGKK